MNSKFTTQKIALIGVFAAFVFVGSWMRVPVGESSIHLGNMPCLLAGLILGPVPGGLAAGIGSALFDISYPAYIDEAWITFINKFFLAFVCGLIARRKDNQTLSGRRRVFAAAAGSLTYVCLYLLKSFILGMVKNDLTVDAALILVLSKSLQSLTNAVAATLLVIPISKAIEKAVKNRT